MQALASYEIKHIIALLVEAVEKIKVKKIKVFSFLPKNLHFKKKMQFCVCFLKMFRPVKGWYVLF